MQPEDLWTQPLDQHGQPIDYDSARPPPPPRHEPRSMTTSLRRRGACGSRGPIGRYIRLGVIAAVILALAGGIYWQWPNIKAA